jgi:hypothetical protein
MRVPRTMWKQLIFGEAACFLTGEAPRGDKSFGELVCASNVSVNLTRHNLSFSEY